MERSGCPDHVVAMHCNECVNTPLAPPSTQLRPYRSNVSRRADITLEATPTGRRGGGGRGHLRGIGGYSQHESDDDAASWTEFDADEEPVPTPRTSSVSSAAGAAGNNNNNNRRHDPAAMSDSSMEIEVARDARRRRYVACVCCCCCC
jgi:hypothetical protein